jgi:hypothetical protein
LNAGKASSIAAVAERPEVKLLLYCARSRRDPEGSARIRTLLQEQIHWGYLLRTARSHRIMPLLFWQLNAISPETVPKNVLDQLGAYFHNNNLRNLSLTGELLRLLREFENHGIHAIPYKGPVLVAFAYGNLALREFDDLDILVRRQDVLRAGELLASFGYRRMYGLTRAQEAAYIRYGDQYSYMRDHDGSIVELHWGFASRAFSFLLSTERQWWRLERMPLGGGTVSTFSPEDLLLILCVHGSMHRWERLQWVCDVAELIHVCREMDWGRLMERATALGCRRALLLGLSLADELLGARSPEEVMQRLQADPVVKTLAGEVSGWLFRDDADSQRLFEGGNFEPFHVKVLERLRDKVRYCFRQATVPSWEDCELLPLPAHLFPAYRLLRPARLTGKYIRRALSA